MDVTAVSQVKSIVSPQPLPVRKLPRLPALACPAPAADSLRLKTATGAIPAVAPLFKAAEPALPPIEVEKRDNYTYYRNAFGQQITQVDEADGKYFLTFSSQGLAVMLRQHNDQRDTLDFTDMNYNISKPSQMPNVFFHVQHAEGKGPSQIAFNDQHEIVIDLANGDQLKLDRTDSQTVTAGPISLRFLPDEAGQNFDAVYCGGDATIKRFKSKGDTVQW